MYHTVEGPRLSLEVERQLALRVAERRGPLAVTAKAERRRPLWRGLRRCAAAALVLVVALGDRGAGGRSPARSQRRA